MKLAAYKPATITLTIVMDEDLAWQLATFYKRATYSTYRQVATSDKQAQDMLIAGWDIQTSLADSGIKV